MNYLIIHSSIKSYLSNTNMICTYIHTYIFFKYHSCFICSFVCGCGCGCVYIFSVPRYDRTKEKNDAERKEIDQIFLSATQVENETKQVEEALAGLYDQAAQRMAALGPDAQEEYTALKEEDAYVVGQIQKKEMELENLVMAIERFHKRMQEPEFQVHRRGVELKKQKNILENQHSELLEETNSNLSPAQLHDKLKERLNRITANVENIETTTKMTENATEKLQDAIGNKERELQDAKGSKRRAEKYEKSLAQDQKLQDFIAKYPKKKQEQEKQKTILQKNIVATMKHISKGLASQENVPDQAKFDEIKNELSFKQSRVKHSTTTLAKLETELAQRKEEVAKINGLDKKITAELQMFKKKITDMKRDAKTFKSIPQLQQEAKLHKAQLSQQKVETAKKREQLKAQVQLLSHSLERKKRELGSNEAMKTIETLQAKLRQNTGLSFTMSEWIVSRKREADWDVLRKQSMALVSDINFAHVKCNRT